MFPTVCIKHRRLRLEALEDRRLLAGQIQGMVWHDMNADGEWEEGELGLAGRTVFLDLDGNGQLDDGEPDAITSADDPITEWIDESGFYAFADLAAGTYAVAAVSDDGWVGTYPDSGNHLVEIEDGQVFTGANFGSRHESRLQVVASSLREGDMVPAGWLVYTAQFNRELSAEGPHPWDVTLKDRTGVEYVAGAFDYDAAAGTLTVEYENLPEQDFRLTMHSGGARFEGSHGEDLDGDPDPADTVPSGNGTPGGDFVVHFGTEVEVIPFPGLPIRKGPWGGLIREQSAGAWIRTPGDTDAFTVDLEGFQTLSVAVEPDATLRPTIELHGPDGALIGSATATEEGQHALLQAVPADDAGTYTILVGGEAESTGSCSLRLVLNALVEEEHAEEPNDNPGRAQDLDAGFAALGVGKAERGAVLGTLWSDQWTESSSLPGGRIVRTTRSDGTSTWYSVLMDRFDPGDANLNEAIWTVDLSEVSQAVLSFYHADWNDAEDPFDGDFVGSFPADGVAISGDGVHWNPAWDVPNQSASTPARYTIDLTAEAAEAGIRLNEDFRIKFQQYGDASYPEGGRSYERMLITSQDPNDDWFRFTLDAGQTASLALEGTAEPVSLELYDADLNLLARGVPAANALRAITDFTATGSGTHYARVSGISPTDWEAEYGLVVTRDGLFDVELDGGPGAGRRNITTSGTALGAVDPEPAGEAITFAVFGDFGSDDSYEENVAGMVKSWQPDFIITTGDNNYRGIEVGDPQWANTVGDYYGEFILGRSDNRYPEQTSPVQRFFPSVGNHDGGNPGVYTLSNGGEISGYLDYLHYDPADPTGGRLLEGVHTAENSYYDFRWGPIHFFALDSDHASVDGASSAMQQGWLRAGLANSTATWKFVFFHHAPYTSGRHFPSVAMQWPFRQWGADAVFTGHNHNYERILLDGTPYFVSGLGGGSIYSFGQTVQPGSERRYNDHRGSMRVSVEGSQATFEFLSIDDGADGANGGLLIDTYMIGKSIDTVDEYTIDVEVSDTLAIETFTPGGGLPASGNQLDPFIELYDPGGGLVADDDNGGPDGRNARLTYPAAAAGTYTVRVRDAGSHGGQYVLLVEGASGTPDDRYEPNDTLAEAYDLAGYDGVWLSAISGQGVQADDDWYRVEVALPEQRLAVDLSFTDAFGDVGLEVYDESGKLRAGADEAIDGEHLDLVRPATGTWYLRVHGSDAGNVYNLRWQERSLYPGDANLDGVTDVRDFNIWNAHKFVDGTDWATGDFDGNGKTDVRDFNVWNAHKFTSAPDPAPVDLVLQREPGRLQTSLGRLVLLCELAQISADDSSPENKTPANVAVDLLLATYWE